MYLEQAFGSLGFPVLEEFVIRGLLLDRIRLCRRILFTGFPAGIGIRTGDERQTECSHSCDEYVSHAFHAASSLFQCFLYIAEQKFIMGLCVACCSPHPAFEQALYLEDIRIIILAEHRL